MTTVGRRLDDPVRLRALRAARLAAAAEAVSLDRLTALAGQVAEAPMSLLSLIDADRQFIVAGAPDDWDTEVPLDRSLCRFVVRDEVSLVVRDTRADPVLHDSAAAGVIAYAGFPVRAPGGDVVGALCVVDAVPRDWPADRMRQVADLAETVTHEIALRLACSELRDRGLDRMREDLVAVVSHELRGPIAAIRGYAEVLLDDPALADLHRRWAGVIDRKSADLERLVGDLLDLAALDSGHIGIVSRPVPLGRLVREAVDEHAPAAAERNIVISAEIGQHLPVFGDPLRLRQVVGNLLSNAVKYTPPGGAVRVTAAIEDGRARLTVADTGIGVPPEEFPLLFERFFRTRTAVERGIKGTGLGLAITKAIVDAHGGAISAAPREGGGTEFTISLPAACTSTAGAPDGP
ncbi:ATP-binding protein [Catenuloplanes japonicus]|uniref:ATP-binding protein n=1 Tax=Catenuloplanes japonicus TaxID=33876 RepID=UPI0012FA3436|nr:ATP-binding protein [Catenuloplanes japonicus]